MHARSPEDRRAAATIPILHLNRRRLQHERARILLRVIRLLEARRLARAPQHHEVVRYFDQLLADYLADDAEYAGLARAVVRDPGAF